MEKIKIKLRKCCLDCEHFDASGIKGLGVYVGNITCTGFETERVIACGHMQVCGMYNTGEKTRNSETLKEIALELLGKYINAQFELTSETGKASRNEEISAEIEQYRQKIENATS